MDADEKKAADFLRDIHEDRIWEPGFDSFGQQWYVTDGCGVLMKFIVGYPFDPTGEKTCRLVCEDHNAAARARKAARKAEFENGLSSCVRRGEYSAEPHPVDAEPSRFPSVNALEGDVMLLRMPIRLSAAKPLQKFIDAAYGSDYGIKAEPMGWAKVTKMGTPT